MVPGCSQVTKSWFVSKRPVLLRYLPFRPRLGAFSYVVVVDSVPGVLRGGSRHPRTRKVEGRRRLPTLSQGSSAEEVKLYL